MNRLADDDSPEAVTVTLNHLSPLSFTRTAEGDTTLSEGDGSLVVGYAYRRNPNRNRVEGPPGVATVQSQVILSLPVGTGIVIGDVVYFPACRATAGIDNVRSVVQQVRSYPTGLQCDMELGAQQVDAEEVP